MGKRFRGRSLREAAPNIASEWHPTLNGDDTPDDTPAGANRKAWWLGKCGHEWDASIASRATKSLGCPICSNFRVLKGFNDLKTTHPEVASEWHPYKNGSISASDVIGGTSKKFWWLGKCGHEWEASCNSRTQPKGSGCPVCQNQKLLEGFNDLAFKEPDLATQWHPRLNGDLHPREVIAGSNRSYWWQCEKGHEWEASPSHRKKSGCGVCAGQILLSGFNDLATRYPKVAARWHKTKNGTVHPSEVFPGSKTKYWWVCEKGHDWEAVASSQLRLAGQRTGCSVCAGKKVMEGVNDLTKSDPKLIKEWHPFRNLSLLPTTLTRGTRRKVWWMCDSGHEWEAAVANRAVSGTGCPYCQHQLLIPGESDLETRSPELARQWHPEKNKPVTSNEVFASSGKQYWWLCAEGHEWKAQPAQRSAGSNCPFCSNQKLLLGYNDLGTNNPSLSIEWHPSKNGGLTPSAVFPNSNKKAWWLGKCGHEWDAAIGSRNNGGAGCPFCLNQQILQGFNDLQTTHQELASEWHPNRNLPLMPHEVTAGSQSKFWWLGKCGHEWRTTCSLRSVQNTGCPFCANQLLLEGFNDLATVGWEILSELHPDRNPVRDYTKVLGFSATKYWWLCSEGHEWYASSEKRLRGTGCPKCAKTGYDQASPGYLYLLRKENLGLHQFGISNTPEKRLAIHKRNGWEVLDAFGPSDGLWVLQTETALKAYFRKKGVLLSSTYEDKFDGYSESWTSTELSFSSVSEMLDALREFEEDPRHN